MNPVERLRKMRENPFWRALAGKVAEETEQRAASSSAGDLDDKLHDSLQPLQVGLPVTFVDDYGNPKVRLPGAPSIIRSATQGDIENYAEAPTRVCGTCRHFQLKEGRQEIVKQKFLQRLVLEQEWKIGHLGAPADHLGVCGQNPAMVTSTIANAGTCPAYCDRRR